MRSTAGAPTRSGPTATPITPNQTNASTRLCAAEEAHNDQRPITIGYVHALMTAHSFPVSWSAIYQVGESPHVPPFALYEYSNGVQVFARQCRPLGAAGAVSGKGQDTARHRGALEKGCSAGGRGSHPPRSPQSQAQWQIISNLFLIPSSLDLSTQPEFRNDI